jgi:dihydroxyacid dehydratase/phosphogluconate dehydratase
MGAASCDLPAIVVSGGPMLNGQFEGCAIGSGTDVWRFSENVRAGLMSADAFYAAESAMSRSPGHCNTMGTASTMASMVEALGLALPENAAFPAVEGRKLHLEVSDAELETRRKDWQPPRAAMAGGYQRLYVDHVMQADQGADFDFLLGCRGCAAPQRESH